MDWTLVSRYLGGQLSPAERVAFERWLEMEPGRRDEMVLIRRIWDDAGAMPNAATVDRMWHSLSRRMNTGASDSMSDTTASGPHQRAGPRRVPVLPFTPRASRWRLPALIAAAAVLVFVVTLAGRNHAARQTGAEAPPPPVKEFRTAPGQRATVQLRDGSRVELGVASAINVSPFTDSSRNVALEGEAMFDIVHDERRPFRVHSAGTITEDLGTRFGIRAYSEDPGVRVFVTSGVVSVRTTATQKPPSILHAGQLARLDGGGAVIVETNIDTTRYLAWTSGRVILRNEPLRSAAIEIGRWHDVTISIPDERVARMRITADMRLASLEATLNAVTIPLGLRYELTEQGAVILR
jgi:transmembrane sensor